MYSFRVAAAEVATDAKVLIVSTVNATWVSPRRLRLTIVTAFVDKVRPRLASLFRPDTTATLKAVTTSPTKSAREIPESVSDMASL